MPARFPHFLHQASKQLLMPLDPQGGGTWILAADNGEAACLLNGAFENHKRRPPYRKSRGRVILESFQYADINDFVAHYNFDQIEPFTLVKVIQNPCQHYQIHEIRWDGQAIHYRTADPKQPQIWSSVTLYDEKMRAKRHQWFDEWLAEGPDFTMESVRHFHLHGGEGDPTVDFRMTRSGGLQTISLTSIELVRQKVQVDYLSLRTHLREKATLELAHH